MRNMSRQAMAMGLFGILAMAAPASAGDFALSIDVEGRHGNHFGLAIGNGQITPVVAPAVVVQPAAPVERIWVPPVYRDVVERVWVPTVETRFRDVPVVDAFGHVIAYRREAYTVPSGYWQNVTRRELVREGFWQTVAPAGFPQRKYYAMGDNGPRAAIELKIGPVAGKGGHEKDGHEKLEFKGGGHGEKEAQGRLAAVGKLVKALCER
jgi:hypothetical protein